MALTTVWLSILILNFFYAFFGSKLWCVQFSPSVEQKNQPSHVNLYVPIKISSVNRHTQKCKKAVIKFICVFFALFHWCVRARRAHITHPIGRKMAAKSAKRISSQANCREMERQIASVDTRPNINIYTTESNYSTQLAVLLTVRYCYMRMSIFAATKTHVI